MIARRLTAWCDWLAEGKLLGLPAAVATTGLYCAFQIAFLPLLSHLAGTGVSHDDGEQLVYMRYLWLGYGGSQPPLYSWLAWGLGQVFGPTIFTLKLLKYTLVFIGLALLHHLVLRIGHSRRTAAAAVFGVVLLPQIVWEMQRQLSHSAALLCFGMLFLVALAAVLREQSLRNHTLLGLAIAAAALSKYNNIIFILAALGSVAMARETRSVVVSRKMLLTLAVAALALAPVLIWAATHPVDLLSGSYKLRMKADGPGLDAAVKGLVSLFFASISSASLPLAVAGLAMIVGRLRFWSGFASPDAYERFLWRTVATALALGAVLIVASSVTRVSDRWLLPVMIPLPIAIALGLARFGAPGRKAQNVIIGAGAFAAMAVLPVSWFVQVNSGDGLGRIVQMKPEVLQREIQRTGETRTVVGAWSWIGNLRLVDPELNVVYTAMPNYASNIELPAVMTWEDDLLPDSRFLAALYRAGYLPVGQIRYVHVPEFLGSPEGRRFGIVRLARAGDGTASGEIKQKAVD
jgi:hypothetical protein